MRGVNSGILLVPLLGSLILSVCSACAQDVNDPMLKQLEEAVESMTGSIDLYGRVVGSDGKPLKDVTIKYFFREFGDALSNREIDYQRMRVDGEFRIKRADISAVHLTILKEGYYSESWSFGFHLDRPLQNPGKIERFDIEIVLEKQPPSAPLRKFEGILRTEVKGPISVVEVKRQGSGETWLWKDGVKRENNWPHVLLVAAEGGDAALPISEFRSKNQRFLKQGLQRGWIRFSKSDEGDGFIIYEPREIPDWAEIGMRGMTEAPETGYEPNLEVAAAESPEMIYFYCRVNGHYGKGMVSGRPIIAVEEDRQVARAAILIFLNPTGSRDVSYVHQ